VDNSIDDTKFFVWSPSGKFLAYFQSSSKVCIVEVADEKVVLLFSQDITVTSLESLVRICRWDKDSSSFMFVSDDDKVTCWSREDGSTKIYNTTFKLKRVFTSSFSPQADSFICICENENNSMVIFDIFSSSVCSSLKYDVTMFDFEWVFHDDTFAVMFDSKSTCSYNQLTVLIFYRERNGWVKNENHENLVNNYTVSSDKTKIILRWSEDKGSTDYGPMWTTYFEVFDLKSKQKIIFPASTPVSFSPDSKWLIGHGNTSGKINAMLLEDDKTDGKEDKFIVSFNSHGSDFLSWSPCGRRFACISNKGDSNITVFESLSN
jgi:hypothetical protein